MSILPLVGLKVTVYIFGRGEPAIHFVAPLNLAVQSPEIKAFLIVR
jgi:hypothetical protein